MKKIITLSVILLASTAFNAVNAGKKKDKVKIDAPVAITTSADSVSYAAGMAATMGLEQFVMSQYDVDSTFVTNFIKGFKESLNKIQDAKFRGYLAGLQIACQANKQILPGIKEQFADTKDAINASLFYEGFIDAVKKDYRFFAQDEAKKLFEARMKADKEAKDKAYREANEKWLIDNVRNEGVVKLPSGLQYKILKEGNGEIPGKDDEVTVKYEGKLIDGTIFDSSYKRDPQTTNFRPTQVIKGWTEALTMMPVGSKWELYIPQELAYGERPAGKIKPYSTLIFTVELISVNKTEEKKK